MDKVYCINSDIEEM